MRLMMILLILGKDTLSTDTSAEGNENTYAWAAGVGMLAIGALAAGAFILARSRKS
jgi:hypothetical protein